MNNIVLQFNVTFHAFNMNLQLVRILKHVAVALALAFEHNSMYEAIWFVLVGWKWRQREAIFSCILLLSSN